MNISLDDNNPNLIEDDEEYATALAMKNELMDPSFEAANDLQNFIKVFEAYHDIDNYSFDNDSPMMMNIEGWLLYYIDEEPESKEYDDESFQNRIFDIPNPNPNPNSDSFFINTITPIPEWRLHQRKKFKQLILSANHTLTSILTLLENTDPYYYINIT